MIAVDRSAGVHLVTDHPRVERIPASDVDFRVRDEQSIILLYPVSDDAVGWVNDHLPEDRTTWGGATIIERRYFEDILNGIDNDGLVVGRSG